LRAGVYNEAFGSRVRSPFSVFNAVDPARSVKTRVRTLEVSLGMA